MNYVTAEDFLKALSKGGTLVVTTDYNRLDWSVPFVPAHVLSLGLRTYERLNPHTLRLTTAQNWWYSLGVGKTKRSTKTDEARRKNTRYDRKERRETKNQLREKR